MHINVVVMNQESVIADIEQRAFMASISIGALCRLAEVNPTTFSRWKRSERNPEPIGATLRSIGKLYDALDQVEKTSRRRRKVAA